MRSWLGWTLLGCAAVAPGCYSGLDADGSGGADDGADEAGSADGDESGADATPPALECDEIGAQALRRISSVQYEQVLRDLLPGAFATAALEVSVFPETSIDGGFSTYASANTVSSNESIQIEDNAERIAEVFYDNRAEFAPALVPCLAEGYAPGDVDGCIDEFIDDFGARAFRRPLTDGEASIVRGLYDGIRESDDPEVGLTAVLHYFLQAPALLYVTEQSGSADEDFVPLSPDELATRLALLFLNSAPDAELIAAVDEGRLTSREDVEAQARRLVDQPEAKRGFAQFHHEWMTGFKLDDEREHELWTDVSAAALRDELGDFARWFLDEADGSFQTLMTTTEFAPDNRLDSVYAAGGARPGLMATAAAMAAQANPDATSLVARGAFIRNHVLCVPAPPFPGNIDIEAPLDGYGELPTARQRLEPLMVEASCASCHVAINPLGFPFEVYDWAGAYRSQENGETIDTTASITLGSLSGDYADAEELLGAIAATDEARDCYAKHWFRYALGRPDADADSCALDTITQTFAESDGDIRELLVAIAVSDAFRFRKVGGGS